MPRRSNRESVDMMVRILRLANDLAHREQGGVGDPVPLAEFAARLGMDERDTIWAIDRINEGCGDAAPEMIVLYDPDEATVTPLRIEGVFEKPLRLTGAEARGLVAAVEAAGYDVDDLAEKIMGTLPAMTDARLLGIRDHAAAAPWASALTTLTAAARMRRVARIMYRGAHDAQARERLLEPQRIVYDDEASMWYAVAWCRSADEWRTFRLDRVVDAQLLDETFEPRGKDGGEPETFSFSRARDAVLVVHDPRAVSDAYDWRGLARMDSPDAFDLGRISPSERAGGAYIARIPWIEGSPWLARTVLRTMGGVEVLRPVRLRDEVRALARGLLDQMEVSG